MVLSRFFKNGKKDVINTLSLENRELVHINQRHSEVIRTLSEQLTKTITFQNHFVQEISRNLKVVGALPTKMEAHQQLAIEHFNQATLLVQKASSDFIQSRKELQHAQHEVFENLGALEIAEFMRSFLLTQLLTKQVRAVVHAATHKAPLAEFDPLMQKLYRNWHIVQMQMQELNTKLEKYHLRLEESVWKPLIPDHATAEVVETCSSEAFSQLVYDSQKIGFLEGSDKIKSLVLNEHSPTVFYFNQEKATWCVKRRGKVVVLRPG